ncbi:MAG: hypothetical protein ACLRTD_24800 [Bacteroides sp.]
MEEWERQEGEYKSTTMNGMRYWHLMAQLVIYIYNARQLAYLAR